MILTLLKVAFVAGGLLLTAVEAGMAARRARPFPVARWAITVCAVGWTVWLLLMFADHLRFPFFLNLMEGTVLQHFRQAAAFEPIYPQPTPEFVPLAYNVLYYVAAVPLAWILGPGLPALRLFSIGASLLCGFVLWRVVRERTGNGWWAWMTVGMFAAAYQVMDAYLDTAHSDSSMLATALLGSYLLGRGRSRLGTLAGMLLLVASFWFKQHGALFAVGGVVFLTRRDGVRRSLPAWVLAAVLGPGLYFLAGPSLFGAAFLHFTWEVPRAWMELNPALLLRVAEYVAIYLAPLALLALWWPARAEPGEPAPDIWRFQLLAACATGLLGTMDPGSSDNVFIPLATWILLLGMLGLWRFSRLESVSRYRIHLALLFLAFGLLLYPPRSILTARAAGPRRAELIELLRSLDAPVYAPALGQLPEGFVFHPGAHWVALEDMVRGPGRDTRNQPRIRALLAEVIEPAGAAYILANHRLDRQELLAFLDEHYVLQEDMGDRFAGLQGLPGRYAHGWPRYLYRHRGTAERSSSLTAD